MYLLNCAAVRGCVWLYAGDDGLCHPELLLYPLLRKPGLPSLLGLLYPCEGGGDKEERREP